MYSGRRRGAQEAPRHKPQRQLQVGSSQWNGGLIGATDSASCHCKPSRLLLSTPSSTSPSQNSNSHKNLLLDQEPYPFVAKCEDQWFDTLNAMEAVRAAPPEMLKTLCSYTNDQGIKIYFQGRLKAHRHLSCLRITPVGVPTIEPRLFHGQNQFGRLLISE